jgi:alginate O-acetyltransferase complex protein AlgJ
MFAQPPRSPADRIVIALFAVLLLAPSILALAGWAHLDTAFIFQTEQREPFVAPPISSGAIATGGWERDFERQAADVFPLRTTLIEALAYAKYAWFGDALGDNVIVGRSGWLFYGAEERAYITGAYQPADAELAALADVFARRSAWCAQHGMHYVFLLAPNKSTIYARFLPDGMTPSQPSPADRFLPLLRARGVQAVDVRAQLIAASYRGDVYSHGDTHWNDAGAAIAARATAAALRGAGVRDELPPSPHSEIVHGGGDLLNIAAIPGVGNALVHYVFPGRAHEIADPRYAGDPAGTNFITHVSAVDNPKLPAAVLFGDSFIEQLRPFLAEDFRRAVFIHRVAMTGSQFDEGLLERERPAVVVDELVERNMTFAGLIKQ